MRASHPAPQSGALFADLISRCRGDQGALEDIAREAQAILDRYEVDARDRAEQLLIDARLEAAVSAAPRVRRETPIAIARADMSRLFWRAPSRRCWLPLSYGSCAPH